MIDKQYLIRLRREFHQIPELAFKEFKTHAKILEYLKSYKIEDIKIIAQTGIVATIYGENKNRTIGVRVDIDAIPTHEENEIDYCSTHDGVMHACGHDGHIAIGIYLAKFFSENKPKCNVKIIFQPAEEGVGGALPMINEGVLSNPDVDFMLGCHLWPGIEVGKVDISYGATFASSDIFKITVLGKGGHGGMPKDVKNSILAASDIVVNLNALFLKEKENGNDFVFSICSFDAKSIYNVFIDNAVLKGTLRTLDSNFQDEIISKIKNETKRILDKHNIDGEIKFTSEYPPLINDSVILDKLKTSALKIVGENNITSIGHTFAAEDFSFFTKNVASAHIRVGIKNEKKGFVEPLHNSKFNMDEDGLELAVRIFCDTITNNAN